MAEINMDLFWICSSDIWSCDGVKLNNKFILVRCRWCLQGWIERVLEERTRRRWLFWCWGSSHSSQNWNHYLGNTNPECPGGEGTKNPWIDVCCTEEIQLPRGNCWGNDHWIITYYSNDSPIYLLCCFWNVNLMHSPYVMLGFHKCANQSKCLVGLHFCG